MTLYAVLVICKKQKIKVNNCKPSIEQSIKISWANGQIGAIPVFDNILDANKYAGNHEIIEVEI